MKKPNELFLKVTVPAYSPASLLKAESVVRQFGAGASIHQIQPGEPLMENLVILREVFAQNDGFHECDYFAVLSPRFFEKVLPVGGQQVTPQRIREELCRPIQKGEQPVKKSGTFTPVEVDAMSFFGKMRDGYLHHEKMKHMMSGKAPDILFEALEACQIPRPENRAMKGKVVISNYIFARPEIWVNYVQYYLHPMIDYLMTRPKDHAVWDDAKYKRKIRDVKVPWGHVDYYTHHTFVLEMLWTVYLASNPEINFRQYAY